MPMAHRRDDRRWVVDGRMLTEDLEDEIGVTLPEGDWTTVGGMVMGIAGDLPRTGAEVKAGGLKVRVTGVSGRRIRKVEIILPGGETKRS